jgi:uncharacterized radical SAM superfamily Fe-S cluster-containing enzyme
MPNVVTERLINVTTSLCRVCKNAIPARIVASGPEVWMRKECRQHGAQEVRLSNNAEWYERTRGIRPTPVPPPVVRTDVNHGCPFDCGPCKSHEQKIRLPVVTITSACNLDCPICYVHNKNQGAFHMGVEDFKKTLDHLTRDHGGDLDLINFTGGEPTVHPHFVEFLELCHQAGIHRVSICTNGLRLAKDEALVERLAKVKARIALSFDTFEEHADAVLQGARLIDVKMKCLELLEKHDVDTTLIPVMTRGVNDHEIGRILTMGLSKRNVRHFEVHTITYTGQGGATFNRAHRMSIYEVLQRIEETTGGLLRPDDFVSSPCAHPLCYQIAYLLMDPDGGPPVPFTRFLSRETVYGLLSDHLYLEPTPKLQNALQEAINRLWSEGGPDSDRTLAVLKRLLREVFPGDRRITREEALKRSERAAKAVYVHSHMDEETFDTERAVQCCDSNCYPDGTTVPVCNYNVLYREKEKSFNAAPKSWNERSGGRFDFPAPGGR